MKVHSLNEVVDKVKDDLEARFSKELVSIIRERFANDFMIIFSFLYDERFGALANLMDSQKDPTSPTVLKPIVMDYVRSEVNAAIASLSVSGDTLRFSFLDYDRFGYPEGPTSVDQDYLKLFFFYMEGVPGSYAFISDEFFSRYLVPGTFKELGRFGRGFMLPEETYNKIATYREGGSSMGSLPKLPAFNAVKSPASGWPPTRIFDDMREPVEILIEQYVNEVAEMVLGGM